MLEKMREKIFCVQTQLDNVIHYAIFFTKEKEKINKEKQRRKKKEREKAGKDCVQFLVVVFCMFSVIQIPYLYILKTVFVGICFI